MNLHVAISGWLLGAPSGANRRLLSLLAEFGPLLAPGERITVLHRPDFAPPPLPGIGWCPLAIPAGPTLRRVLAEQRLLVPALAKIGANVFDHGFLPLPDVPISQCLLLHDLRGPDGFSRWPRWFARHALRNSCRRTDAIVVPSRFTAERLRTLAAPQAPIHVVGNGVALPAPATPPPAVREHLLHVGHIEPRKNLGVVLRALAHLPAAQRPPLHLVGADAGSLRGLRSLATRLGMPDALLWLGPRDDAGAAEQYATARAIVVPSRYEGFGLCALEGLAHGRPVLAADAGALPEVVGDCGTVLPPDDPAAWARAIAALPRPGEPDPARDHRRAHAAGFSWAASAARQLAIWRELWAR
jgi:glycosyltransferase involved in cell wall biosynthesis